MSRALLGILILSGLLKVALAFGFADLQPRYDESDFLQHGAAVAAGEAPALFRAPGYQMFVALGLSVAGGSPVGVRLLQALLSVATTWLVYRTTRRVAGERTALVVAGFLAFYPSHVAFSHLLWAETLFLFLAVWAFDRLLVADERRSPRAAAHAGVVLGLCALVRSMGVVLLLASVVWMLLRRDRRAPVVVALLVAAVVVIAPWSIHASSRHGSFVLVDTNGGWNLFSGHNEWIPEGLQGIWSVGLPLGNGVESRRGAQILARELPGRLALERPDGDFRARIRPHLVASRVQEAPAADRPESDWFRATALDEVRRDPLGALQRVPLKLAAWWSPDFFLPRHLLRDWYGATPPALAATIAVLTLLAATVPLLAGPAALATIPRSRFTTLTLAWVVAAAIVHGALFGVSRMHQPYVPALVMAAGIAFVGTERPLDRRRLLRRGLPWSAIALVLWILAAPAVVGLYVSPGTRHVGVARATAMLGTMPLPAARYVTWMHAEVEAAAGDEPRAARFLATGRFAEHPWTLCQRALLTDDRTEARRLVEKALRDPGAPALARRLRDELAREAP